MSKRIYWHYPTFAPYASYAKLGYQFRRAFYQHVPDIEVIPLPPYHLRETPTWAIHDAYPDIGAIPTIVTGTAGYMKNIHIGRIWALTMYESTQLPGDWVPTFNDYAERVIVPHEWVYNVFRGRYDKTVQTRQRSAHTGKPKAGYAGFMHIVPLGVNVGEFTRIDRTHRNVYTFGCLADHGMRKGWDMVLSAFADAFGAYGQEGYTPDVRLIIKSVEQEQSMIRQASYFRDRRVRLWHEDMLNLMDYYTAIDCLVFPSRAEGFGLPPREATCTGAVTIATDYSGMAGDGGVSSWGIPLAYTEVDVDPFGKQLGYKGKWAAPDYDNLVETMRWCYLNDSAGRSIADNGRAWISDNQTWGHSVKAFTNVFEQTELTWSNGNV